MDLTLEHQRAVDAAEDAPARVQLPGEEQPHVLLPANDFDWIRGLVPDIPDAARAADPRTGRMYAYVPLLVYERFKAFFEDDPLSREEQLYLLREMGKRAGWDDPGDGHLQRPGPPQTTMKV